MQRTEARAALRASPLRRGLGAARAEVGRRVGPEVRLVAHRIRLPDAGQGHLVEDQAPAGEAGIRIVIDGGVAREAALRARRGAVRGADAVGGEVAARGEARLVRLLEAGV